MMKESNEKLKKEVAELAVEAKKNKNKKKKWYERKDETWILAR